MKHLHALFKVGTLKAYHSFYGVQETDIPTLIVNGRAFVFMRFGAGVVDASITSRQYLCQNPADQVPTIIDGRTYLPARVLGQVSCDIYYLGGENANNLGEFVVYTSGEATNSELLTMVKEGNGKIV